MLVALSRARRDPGYLACHMRGDKALCQGNNNNIISSSNGLGNASSLYRAALSGIAMNSHTDGSARLLKEEPNGVAKDWCPKCRLVRPPRAGHCQICGRCVKRLDHHCVWINSCVGEQNHQAFILALSLFLLTSLYGIYLTLDTICRGKATLKALFYCPGVYADYSSALSFTCVWYCVIVTSGMGYILLIQLLNISYNVTEREARIALRESSGRRLLCGLVVDTGQYNRGFLRNWIHFFTLGSPALQHSTEAIV